MGIYLSPSGKRRLSPSGKLILGSSGGGGCCGDLYQIKVCAITTTSFGVTEIPDAGRWFWGNNYIAQGLMADVLYYISDVETSGLSQVTMDPSDTFPAIMPSASEGVGVTINNGCNYSATVGVTGYWKYSSPDLVVNTYMTGSSFFVKTRTASSRTFTTSSTPTDHQPARAVTPTPKALNQHEPHRHDRGTDPQGHLPHMAQRTV